MPSSLLSPRVFTTHGPPWRVSQVFGVHDFVADGNQSVTFTTSLVTTDPRWLALKGDVDSVAVTVVDIDVAGVRCLFPLPLCSFCMTFLGMPEI